ncbi:bifunctional precorrin-2 dehydrogenase/sirohydrochlorin ferrochelatase [Silicimonas sp. MF1-12-2]|uniref:precorrin-2 dehydrogenase/sirohydrochlorin ferrochelatase family protein n=1 Tax=Silicimonas sp. MF1-12-2 TaxID=3384793 RepID=UPI0039B671DE
MSWVPLAEAVPHAEEFVSLVKGIARSDSRSMLEAGDIGRAKSIIDRIHPLAKETLPKSDHMRLQAGYLADQLQQQTGSFLSGQSAGQALVEETPGSRNPLLELGALEERSKMEVMQGRMDLFAATLPEIVDRDPIIVAIGSEGTAPVLTRDIEARLEQMLPQNLGGLAALVGRLRPSVDVNVPRARGRDQISLVGAGPCTGDLMTLRTVQRLQNASQQVWEPAPDIGKQLAHLLIATERIFSPSPP